MIFLNTTFQTKYVQLFINIEKYLYLKPNTFLFELFKLKITV